MDHSTLYYSLIVKCVLVGVRGARTRQDEINYSPFLRYLQMSNFCGNISCAQHSAYTIMCQVKVCKNPALTTDASMTTLQAAAQYLVLSI